MQFWSVYVITNLINGKQYVGIAKDYQNRWTKHRWGHGSKLVYQAIKKYGIDNFVFEVIELLPEAEAKEMEIALISALKTKPPHGYNLTDGGEGSKGYTYTDEHRQKIRMALTGIRRSRETREKMSRAQQGRMRNPHTPETREKIGLANRGKTTSERTRQRMSESARKKPVIVDGRAYSSMKEAAEAMDMKPMTLTQRFHRYRKSGNWPEGWAERR